MTEPAIQSHSDAFDERNQFLALALGAASYASKLEALVQWGLRHPARPGARPSPDPDSEVLYFVLGLTAFARQATAALDAARQPSPEDPGPPLSGSALDMRSMLE